MTQNLPLYNIKARENLVDYTKAIGSRISTIILTSIPIMEPDRILNLNPWLKSFFLMHKPQCLDPDNILYSFHSLFTPKIQRKISINYAMPIADLFALLTRVYIETTRNL